MCRWAAYLGEPIYMADVIAAPKNSLVHQSHMALESVTETNADGFGLAWYQHRQEPGLFRDVHPAWSDANLRSVAEQVKTGLFLAHVRASTGTATSRENCHPFSCENFSFMHNGQVGGFGAMRKAVDMMIPERLYPYRRGSTDSEAMFLLAMAAGLKEDPKGALEQVVGQLEAMSKDQGVAPHIRMTVALSDGDTLYAVRYASDDQAPTLYYRRSTDDSGWMVVSEPLEEPGEWEKIDCGAFLSFSSSGVRLESFQPA